jgi:hypothetical protein
MKIPIAIGVALFPWVVASGYPPGSPMSEFGPSQVALGVFYEHSGQDLYVDNAPSVLNGAGINLDYAPWTFLQFGVFAGGTEFDQAVAPLRLSDTSAHSFNTDYAFSGGGSAKLATPRIISNTTRLVAFGAATYLNNEDKYKNVKKGLVFNAGGTFQFMLRNRLNFALGGEFYAMDGEQESSAGKGPAFGFSAPTGQIDQFRGIVGVEYFFKGKNTPFVSVVFRPTGNMDWDEKLGLRNGSISVSLGAITTLGKAPPQIQEEEADASED